MVDTGSPYLLGEQATAHERSNGKDRALLQVESDLPLDVPPPRVDFSKVPSWLVEISPNRAQKIANYLTSYFFWKTWDEKQETLLSTHKLARAISEAKMKALDQVVDLVGATENAMLIMLEDARSQGWWALRDYEDIEAFFQDKLEKLQERSASNGAISDYRSLVTLLGTLKAMNIPKEYVLELPQNISKAREATRWMKNILATDASQEEQAEIIKEILVQTVDPNVSVRELRDTVSGRTRGLHRPVKQAPRAQFYLMPHGKELVVLWSEGQQQTNTIQAALRGLTELEIGDPGELLKEITQSVSPKSTGLSGHKLHPVERRLEAGINDGLFMPTPERMERLILLELVRYLPVLEQIDDPLVEIPIFELGRTQTLRPWIYSRLKANFVPEKDGLVEEMFSQAIQNYYRIPADAIGFLPGSEFELLLRWDSKRGDVTINLIISR